MIATVPLTLLASPLTMLPIALAKLALPDYALGYLVLVIWITTGRWILNRLQPSPLRVGADGLAWKEGRQTRFVAHRDIEDACFEPASKFWGGFRLVLKTTSGEVPIEELRKDARVWTLDHGLQPIRWINARKVPAEGRFAPVVFRAGVIGNKRDLKVSPQHRMMLSGSRAALLFGEDEVLAAAKHLTNWDGVYIETGGEVEYFHILFDRHEIIIADGAMSESFHPAEGALDSLAGAARGPWAILIGPEGAFSQSERARLTAMPQAITVSLGPRILRADTAAVAAMTLWQTTLGDWT